MPFSDTNTKFNPLTETSGVLLGMDSVRDSYKKIDVDLYPVKHEPRNLRVADTIFDS